jgi:hypothetical protein
MPAAGAGAGEETTMRSSPDTPPLDGARRLQKAQLEAIRYLVSSAVLSRPGQPMLGTPAPVPSPPLPSELLQHLEDTARRFRGGRPLTTTPVPPPAAVPPRRQVAATAWPAPQPAAAVHKPTYIELARNLRLKFGVRSGPRPVARAVAPAPTPPPVITMAPTPDSVRFAELAKALRAKFGVRSRPRR